MIPTRRSRGSPPRILFLATDLSTGGGVNKIIRDLAVLFRRRLSADVTVVSARSDAASAYDFPDDVPVQSHKRQSLLSYFLLLLRLRRSGPDVVISSWTQDNILVTLAFLFSSTKVVLAEHSSWHLHGPGIRLLRRLVYPLASALVVLNRRDLEHYSRFLRSVRLIPNPVSGCAAPAVSQREKLILSVGHLEPLKQFDHALRAMAKSGLEDEGWLMAIIGSGSEAPRLQELIDELGLKKTRLLPNDELGNWYARATLFLLPSRSESFSLVLAEAMLAGVVPIAYATDGPSFILEEFPENLVPPGNLELLAEQLVRFANGAGLEPLRSKLRNSVETRFSPDVVANQWKELLQS
jgi:glycosyltransferase involved in cell wall biosynthesis